MSFYLLLFVNYLMLQDLKCQPLQCHLLHHFLKRNNLEKITLHELRHTFCTNAIASGVDATTVQYLMGHEDSRMTMDLYSHPSLEKILGCAEQLHGYVAA